MCQAWARAGNNSLYLHGDYVGVGSAVNEQSVNKHTVRFRVGNLRSKRKVSEARGTAYTGYKGEFLKILPFRTLESD